MTGAPVLSMPWTHSPTFPPIESGGFTTEDLVDRPRARAVQLRLRTLAYPVFVRIKAFDQFRKHGHNTYQHFFEGETMHESNSVRHKLTYPFCAGILPTDS